MKNLKLILIIALFLTISCSFNLGEKSEQNANGAVNQTAEKPVVENPLKADDKRSDAPVFSDDAKKETAAAQTDCTNLKRGGMKLDKKQTFPVDFAPYQGACFATFHEPDFDDPPLGEKFFIYKNGKEIFEFPEQSQAATYTVKAVAFEDLNGDNLTDIIVVGSAGAKSGSVYSNQVFTNTSRDFYTDSNANMKLDDFTKISEIKNFVSKNPKIFFP